MSTQRERRRTARRETATAEESRSQPSGSPPAGRPPSPRQGSSRPAWRQTIDSFGGFVVVGGILFAVVAVIVMVAVTLPGGGLGGGGDLMGEEVPMSRATHVNDPSQLEIQPGIPPSGGPHFPTWVRGGGEYPEPVNDGQVIHSLEHGYIWISYNPDLVTEDDLEVLREVTNRHQRDVILSPRPENALPIAAVSWGRLLRMDSADGDLLDEFVRTNRNNAPEPGIRP